MYDKSILDLQADEARQREQLTVIPDGAREIRMRQNRQASLGVDVVQGLLRSQAGRHKLLNVQRDDVACRLPEFFAVGDVHNPRNAWIGYDDILTQQRDEIISRISIGLFYLIWRLCTSAHRRMIVKLPQVLIRPPRVRAIQVETTIKRGRRRWYGCGRRVGICVIDVQFGAETAIERPDRAIRGPGCRRPHQAKIVSWRVAGHINKVLHQG